MLICTYAYILMHQCSALHETYACLQADRVLGCQNFDSYIVGCQYFDSVRGDVGAYNDYSKAIAKTYQAMLPSYPHIINRLCISYS